MSYAHAQTPAQSAAPAQAPAQTPAQSAAPAQAPAQPPAPVQPPAPAQTQTQTQAQTPVSVPVVVKERSFAAFSFGVTLLIVLAVFSVVYLSLRRKGTPRHIDDKAGDEGED